MNYLTRQIDDARSLRWEFFARKLDKFRYINPLAGLLFTLRNKYYETEGCKFDIAKELTSIIYRARFYYDLYENEERQLIKEFVRDDDRVIEVGACIGIVSCVTNKKLTKNPEMHVVVEPNPNLIPYIETNRRLNNCQFHIEQCLITDEPNPYFYTDEHISKGSRHQKTENRIEVTSCRLADLEKKYGEFNVLIMDIQGSEKDLLELEESALDRFRLVVAEFHPSIIGEEAVEHCRQILLKHGFEFAKRIKSVEAWQRIS